MAALEHTLIMLLLLIGLLNANPKIPRFVQWVLVGGVLLAFVTPSVPVELPWQWLSALLVPLLIWQTAHRLAGARWQTSYRDAVIWIFLIIGVTTVVSLTSSLNTSIAFLFALLVASMVWQATQQDRATSLLGLMGPLTLAFLLTEVDPAITNPSQYVLSLLGGLGVGAVTGYLAVQAAIRLPVGLPRNILTVGQVYLAYFAALLLNISGVAAAVLSVVVAVAYGVKRGLWVEGQIRPRPFDSPFLFIPAAVVLAFFAWQMHVPLVPALAVEIALTLLVVFAAVIAGRWINSPMFSGPVSPAWVVARAALLLVPVVLLWQPAVPLEAGPLALALFIAGITTLGAHLGVTPLLDLYRWLDELDLDADEVEAEANLTTLRVGEVMRRDWIAIDPQMPVPQIARLLADRAASVGFVIGQEGRLIGIVTEADLFVKEEQWPRTDQTYPSLFNAPVSLNRLVEDYAKLAEHCLAADIMTEKVVSVKENHSVVRSVQEMVRLGIDCLPVMGRVSAEEETIVGVITRADIIHALMDGRQAEYPNQLSSSIEL